MIKKILAGNITRVAKMSVKLNTTGIAVNAMIHPLRSENILIYMPGYGETVRGPDSRGLNLANDLITGQVSAIVRMDNKKHPNSYNSSIFLENLGNIVEYTLKNSQKICGQKAPNIILAGFSLGAYTIASLAHKYTAIKKIMLIAPVIAMHQVIEEGLKKYQGETYILRGERDRLSNKNTIKSIENMSSDINKIKTVSIPKCCHSFKGNLNQWIFRLAPMWAILGDDLYPRGFRGIEFYYKK
jgi:predicted esterase YcpF (UPF0227 family)